MVWGTEGGEKERERRLERKKGGREKGEGGDYSLCHLASDTLNLSSDLPRDTQTRST